MDEEEEKRERRGLKCEIGRTIERNERKKNRREEER